MLFDWSKQARNKKIIISNLQRSSLQELAPSTCCYNLLYSATDYLRIYQSFTGAGVQLKKQARAKNNLLILECRRFL